MRKLIASAMILATTFAFGLAQDNSSSDSREEIIRLAKAPSEPDGIGRAVVVVSDTNGNPIPAAYATLESTWGGDHFCESFGSTNRDGMIALLPIHMGTLKLIVKAKGYESTRFSVTASSLSEPLRVTMARK